MHLGSLLLGYARYTIALGLGALLLYAGAAMQRAVLGPGEEVLYLAAGLLLALAGGWSIASIGSSRAAAWVALLVAGVAPVLVFLGWMATGANATILDSILWANLVAGLLAGVTAGWLVARGPGSTGRGEGSRVARV